MCRGRRKPLPARPVRKSSCKNAIPLRERQLQRAKKKCHLGGRSGVSPRGGARNGIPVVLQTPFLTGSVTGPSLRNFA